MKFKLSQNQFSQQCHLPQEAAAGDATTFQILLQRVQLYGKQLTACHYYSKLFTTTNNHMFG